MTNIKILYVTDNPIMRAVFADPAAELLSTLDARSELTDTSGLADKLKSDPNWSLVIVHVNSDMEKEVYEITDRCRGLSNAIFVGESSVYPWGEEEIRQHFDEYIDVRQQEKQVKELLKKYGFILL